MANNEKPAYEPKKQMKAVNKEPLPSKTEMPASNPAVLKSVLEAARVKVTDAFKAFHAILSNKKLDKNKSPQERDNEGKIAQDLFNAAGELDQINAGEGVMIIGSVSIRELLKMRDRMNEIEYTALLTRKELNALKEALGEKKE
jgi:hypothetical protein